MPNEDLCYLPAIELASAIRTRRHPSKSPPRFWTVSPRSILRSTPTAQSFPRLRWRLLGKQKQP